jgi:hypothetical protein
MSGAVLRSPNWPPTSDAYSERCRLKKALPLFET